MSEGCLSLLLPFMLILCKHSSNQKVNKCCIALLALNQDSDLGNCQSQVVDLLHVLSNASDSSKNAKDVLCKISANSFNKLAFTSCCSGLLSNNLSVRQSFTEAFDVR